MLGPSTFAAKPRSAGWMTDASHGQFFTGLDGQIDSQITTGVGAEVLNGRVDDTGTRNTWPACRPISGATIPTIS
jgi:hypothetical protein